jgi:hypothetical protein
MSRSVTVNKLIDVLQDARRFLSLPQNDFSWSSWASSEAAVAEINGLIGLLREGRIPPKLDVAVLFAVTGPIQEVSLSSGWAQPFLDLAARFDDVDSALWPS